jgi:antitoxin component YwqK of YwqJK toxin-antitoxin module
MLQLLSNNIIEYVLNLYLDCLAAVAYEEDINKIKQLYYYKFSIKTHIKIKIFHWANGSCKSIKCYFDNKIYRNKGYYINGKISLIEYYKNWELNGKSISYHENGKISLIEYYKNGELEDVKWV